VLPEIIQDRLPSVALHFDRVLVFGLEGLGDLGGVALTFEKRFNLSPIIKGIGDAFMGLHVCVYSAEIEAYTAIFCSHSGLKSSILAEVVFSIRCMPGVYGESPLRNVFRLGEVLPHFFNRCINRRS